MYEIALRSQSKTIVLPDVRLTGPGDFTDVDLILDTGALCSTVTWNDAVFIGYDPSNAPLAPVYTSADTTIEAPIILLRSISVGDIVVENLPAVCLDLPGMVEARGVLGLSFLKQVRTVIDYRSLRLQIE